MNHKEYNAWLLLQEKQSVYTGRKKPVKKYLPFSIVFSGILLLSVLFIVLLSEVLK